MASDNQRAAAQTLLNDSIAGCGRRAEALLTLHAAYRLLGFKPPESLWAGEVNCEDGLQIGWTPSWTRRLVDFVRGYITFAELEESATTDNPSPTHLIRRLSAAHFLSGVELLASGRRADAEAAFDRCWHTRDFENYCFRGKLLCLRMRLDPAWPAWTPRPE